MSSNYCSHLRFRNNFEYAETVEELVTAIEKQYNVDLRILPQWKELLHRLHVSKAYFKRRIQDAKRRKHLIIDKINTEFFRTSPFELTDNLARTAKLWEKSRITRKKQDSIVTVVPDNDSNESLAKDEDISEEISCTAHPNTEIVPSEAELPRIQTSVLEARTSSPHLPLYISTNPHKLITPPGSHAVTVSFKSDLEKPDTSMLSHEANEWETAEQALYIKCTPNRISISNATFNEQIFKFSITNCSLEYKYIRFKCLTDTANFKRFKVSPVTSLKLYPGVAVIFTFVFKLLQCTEDFTSYLYFKIGHKITEKESFQALCLPIVSKFKIERSVSVTEDVCIPPIYLWQINSKLRRAEAVFKVCVNDNNDYYMRIVKKEMNLTKDLTDSLMSVETVLPETESNFQNINGYDYDFKSNQWSPVPKDPENISISSKDFMFSIVEVIVELALETFVFDHTYLYLGPYSKSCISVLFNVAKHIGHHHCSYEIQFSDPKTNDILLTKKILVFAEILPHPIQVSPSFLDMSLSPVQYGLCSDKICIKNTHKSCPVTIEIKLTSKMKKLFRINPIKTSVPPASSVNFTVTCCSRDFLTLIKPKDLIHFTFKIVVIGDRSIYHNVPPLFYEIIAPCFAEFKKIYDSKYFTEVNSDEVMSDA